MKKILVLFTMLAVMTSSFASFTPVEPPKKAAELFIPIGKTGKQISLLDLSQIKVKDFETLSGRNMKLMDKLSFKLAQRELRKSINEDGTLNNKRLNKLANKMAVDTSDFNIGGFALGFFLSLIGVLIAYVISDDKKAQRTKWAWIGFGVSVVLYLLFLLL